MEWIVHQHVTMLCMRRLYDANASNASFAETEHERKDFFCSDRCALALKINLEWIK